MADVRATKNGNWSDTTVWNTGALPTAADDVYTNNFTVNVDTSFNVLTLRSTSGTGITAGGTYNFNTPGISGSVTGPIPIIFGAGSQVLNVTADGGGIVKITLSPVTFGGLSGNIMTHSGNCDVILDGGFTLVNGTSSNGGRSITKTSPGTLTITGNISMTAGPYGAGGSNNAIINNTAGSLVINGNVKGPTFGGGGNTAILISVGNLTINGNIEGGPLGPAISSATTGNITTSGSITSDIVTAISLTGASTLTVTGSVTARINVPAVVSTNINATNIFTGPFINPYNTMAVQCARLTIAPNATPSWNYGNITLYSPSQIQLYPSSSDVRQGTVYAEGTLTGSLIIPSSSLVISGVPTDNTTGSAVLLPSELQNDIWNRDLGQMTVTESIGYRLVGVATTDSMGKQISSYLV